MNWFIKLSQKIDQQEWILPYLQMEHHVHIDIFYFDFRRNVVQLIDFNSLIDCFLSPLFNWLQSNNM